MAKLEIQGRCDPRFKRVRELFEAGFESGAELGAGLNVVVDGRELIDLWGGFADRERTRPWRRDTLANVYSTTKGITASAASSSSTRRSRATGPSSRRRARRRFRCACS